MQAVLRGSKGRWTNLTASHIARSTRQAKTLGYDEKQLDFDGIQSAIEKAGYGVREPEQEDEHAVAEEEEKERKDSFRRLMVAEVCAVPVFYLNINHMIPAITPPVPAIFNTYPIINALIQLVLACIVLWCGRGFFIRGYRSLFSGSPNMDTLVAIALRPRCWRVFMQRL